MASDWVAHFERERERYGDGIARLGGIQDPDERQRQLTRIANALYGAGLALLMDGRAADAAESLVQAAGRYRESYSTAPAGSWGRPIGAVKARVMAGDWAGAADDARWTLDEGAADSESPVGRYAGCLALLVLERDDVSTGVARTLQGRDDFPSPVGDALHALAQHDRGGYERAVETVLASFEGRDEFLEAIPVADTVIVLQALAARRGFAAPLASAFLPPERGAEPANRLASER
jgi:hypothetical protein